MSFQITADLTGSKILDPTSFGVQAVPTGAYRCRYLDGVEHNAANGNKSIKITAELLDGEHKGTRADVYLGTDFSKQGVRNQWKALMVSFGAPEEQLNGMLVVDSASLTNREGFLYIKQSIDGTLDDKGRKPLPDVSFIAPKIFAALSSKMALPAQPGVPAGATAGTTGQTVFGIPGITTPANGGVPAAKLPAGVFPNLG